MTAKAQVTFPLVYHSKTFDHKWFSVFKPAIEPHKFINRISGIAQKSKPTFGMMNASQRGGRACRAVLMATHNLY